MLKNHPPANISRKRQFNTIEIPSKDMCRIGKNMERSSQDLGFNGLLPITKSVDCEALEAGASPVIAVSCQIFFDGGEEGIHELVVTRKWKDAINKWP